MLDRLKPDELGALVRFRDERYPSHTLPAVAHYLLLDHLIGLGLLPLPKNNRGKRAGGRK